jgi:hypothetical protein
MFVGVNSGNVKNKLIISRSVQTQTKAVATASSDLLDSLWTVSFLPKYGIYSEERRAG